MEKDILSWVKNSPLYPKVYWKERGSHKLRIALGAKSIFYSIPPPSEGLCFGLFAKESGHQENPFFQTTFFFSPAQYFEEEFREIDPIFTSLQAYKRVDIPDFPSWQTQVELALHLIHQKKIDKMVLSRQTKLVFNEKINPFNLFETLLSCAKEATYFLFQLSEDESFLGASPEKLYQKQGTTLITEALAGTKPRGKTFEEDEEKKRELLTSSKERREFLMVKQYLQAQLAPLCHPLSWEEDRLISTPTVHHLFSSLKASLKTRIADDILIPLLHPTPAIAGFPRPDALFYLNKQESVERGWFAAPIGWVSPEESDIAIAIRSACVRENEMVLFAGAGIVDGSNPEEEWNELNHKISTIYRE